MIKLFLLMTVVVGVLSRTLKIREDTISINLPKNITSFSYDFKKEFELMNISSDPIKQKGFSLLNPEQCSLESTLRLKILRA